MKFYFKIDDDSLIRDAITYPFPGYTEVNLGTQTHLPAGINGGYYLWNGTSYSVDLVRKEEADKRAAGEVGVLKDELTALDERTLGMQEIDFYTLDKLNLTDERTEGMQDIDTYTLDLVFQQQAEIDNLKAEIQLLKGGA